MKNDYIYERKGKNGITLQVKIPFGSKDNRSFKCASFKVKDFPSKAAAYQAARMKRDEFAVILRNAPSELIIPTVKDLYEKYWEVSPYTIQTKNMYNSVYNYVMKPYENITIDRITAFDIQSVLTTYAETHSEKMINNGRAVWKFVFRTAQMQGLNISDKTLMLLPIVSKIPESTDERKRISYDDFVIFTSSLLDRKKRKQKTEKIDRDVWHLLWIMYYTGCRPAEVLALCSSDIDFKNHLLRISKSIGSTKKERRQIVTTKRPSSVRNIPMCEGLESVLKSLLSYSDSSPLLLASDGLPYDINKIVDRVRTTERLTGIDFNSYQLRHIFSDDMFANKISPVVIRDLMGHASSTMSLDYAQSSVHQRADAITIRSGNKLGTE